MKSKSKKQLVSEAEKMLKVIEKEEFSNEFSETIGRLAPVIYQLAIAGAVSSIISESLKNGGLLNKKRKKKKK